MHIIITIYIITIVYAINERCCNLLELINSIFFVEVKSETNNAGIKSNVYINRPRRL